MPTIREPVVATERVWDFFGINLVRGIPNVTQPQVVVTLFNIADLRLEATKSITYSGEEAVPLLNYVNTANFSTVTLYRRIMDKLLADGHLTGVVEEDPVA